jgi:hypothetical protein
MISITFAGLVTLMAVPAAASGPPDNDRAPSASPVAVQRVAVPGSGIRDEAAMVLIGGALIGLAAAVRRAA